VYFETLKKMEGIMPTADFTHPLFGLIKFKTVLPTWTFGGEIEFLDGFDVSDIKQLRIPQLENVPGTNGGRLKFHKRAHQQVLAVFADIERLGLLHHIKTCAGSLNFRLRKPTSGVLSKKPSNHAFGIAIDLNADDGSLGASVAPVAPVFEGLGFLWGTAFNDPMHFEVSTFIDHPNSIAQPLATTLGGRSVDLAAVNFKGEPIADLAKAARAFGLSINEVGKSSAKVSAKGRPKSVRLRMLGGVPFVSLPQIAGLAKLKTSFDNDGKAANFETLG
jgi:D-alanyl-D-alanine carboxypeptidase